MVGQAVSPVVPKSGKFRHRLREHFHNWRRPFQSRDSEGAVYVDTEPALYPLLACHVIRLQFGKLLRPFRIRFNLLRRLQMGDGFLVVAVEPKQSIGKTGVRLRVHPEPRETRWCESMPLPQELARRW